nr:MULTISPECIES: FG-GAP-like repeat-containing protein [unclassified Roseateles]
MFRKFAQCWAVPAALLVVQTAHALSVGSGGQASYGLQIAVPPGVAGMAPNLALSYVDGGLNGPVGVGWSVQGISTVTRCPSSKLIDGIVVNGVKVLTGSRRSTVRFDAQDRLCLDGQRLIAVNQAGTPAGGSVDDAAGMSGATVREFRTEKDSFARIRAYGMAVSGNPDAGPEYFKVWTKSGQIYEYGTSPAGSVASQARINAQGTAKVAVWAVSRISDTVGNYIDFKYEQLIRPWGSGPTLAGVDGLEWNLREVQYGGNASSVNKVVFNYSDRDAATTSAASDRSEAYQGSSKNISIRRLSSIQTFVNSANREALGAASSAVLVRSWMLAYEISPRSGRSRLTSVKECSDAAASKCLPATTLIYSNGAAPNFVLQTGFATSPLATAQLIDPQGGRGNLTGDFNGDGKTDIIRWSNNPLENELWQSSGGGSFSRIQTMNLNSTDRALFDRDGCYSSIVMDFNGDGRSDILRIAKTTCAHPTNIYISEGAGLFTAKPLPAGVNLTQSKTTVQSYRTSCTAVDSSPPTSPAMAMAGKPASDLSDAPASLSPSLVASPTAIGSGDCLQTVFSQGRRFHLLDVNSDGLPDIVTTLFPHTMWNSARGQMPHLNQRCSNAAAFFDYSNDLICTQVYLNKNNGVFEEVVNHPNAKHLLYNDPPASASRVNPYWKPLTEADMDGDGLIDIVAKYSGLWRSKGDGEFEPLSNPDYGALCALKIDFNADQRGDCLQPDANPSNQVLTVYGGALPFSTASFNLKSPGQQLYAADAAGNQTLGVIVEDVDGDGRQDILRWSNTTSENGVFLSNGDGSFRVSTPAGLNALPEPLTSLDGTRSFITGDFLGNGSLQLLQLRSDSAPGGTYPRGGGYAAKANVLLTLEGDRTPVDHLISVTTGSGVVFSVDRREPLTTSESYASDRGTPNAAANGQVDIQPPSYVITAVSKTTPGYGSVQTKYSYHGFKAERDGRGMLGFRETRQQNKAPNGTDLTVVTRNLLTHPYIGVAGATETYLGAFANSAAISGYTPLSRTTYSYCDKTSGETARPVATGGVAPLPCITTSVIQRPYLSESLEEGWDLFGSVLPSVRTTNLYNDFGDPTNIAVVTIGSGAGATQTFKKTVANEYQAPETSGDNWILGRLQSAAVTQSVSPANLPTTSAGLAGRATQRDGNVPIVQPPPQPVNLAALLAILFDD